MNSSRQSDRVDSDSDIRPKRYSTRSRSSAKENYYPPSSFYPPNGSSSSSSRNYYSPSRSYKSRQNSSRSEGSGSRRTSTNTSYTNTSRSSSNSNSTNTSRKNSIVQKYMPPDFRPSKADREEREKRKQHEKECGGFDWSHGVELALVGAAAAFGIEKALSKSQKK